MFNFFHNYLSKKWKDVKVLMTDTDSLFMEIKTEDFYADILGDVEEFFDTSDYVHPPFAGFPTGKNKKVPGKFKDETAGKPIREFVGLKAKLYSFLLEGKEEKRCKGIQKAEVKNKICFQDYKDCLLSREDQTRKMNVIRSRKHELFSETIEKVALSAEDDKRWILEDGIKTLALGH